jgi:hypothetical protein
VEQRVLFRGIAGHVELAGHCRVDELDDDVVSDAVYVPIAPLLERESGWRVAALFRRPLIEAA